MKAIQLLFIIVLLSCNYPKDQIDTKMETSNQNNEIFLGKVVILLSEDLDQNSNAINIQDYIENGKSFIPIFSSIDAFNESAKGVVKNPKIEIDGIFFLSLLNGNETLRLNPSLENEEYFNAAHLIEKHSVEIADVKSKR